MKKIIFYEKPGCINNTKQKAILLAAGHQLEARNLLTEVWTPTKLRAFFGTKPVVEWFNYSAPQIKSGQIIPAQLDENTALKLMLSEPLLIRRPLIQVGNEFAVGFDLETINNWIGINSVDNSRDLETCPRGGKSLPNYC
ncbi:ArsC/Spx/MgsR family protein [Oscillatoria salina]|uniref:ArsC/Spx/MgsR family protein n=1 Tax=Oscillatoria salina TaxID=331517 RepID=UPI001CCAF2D7|nr:ArsC/Spx/MgsR family protein [Oscillatoria salina]MBZ8181703.1 hypothetical protein [Oscillatoria salina IIICB1]